MHYATDALKYKRREAKAVEQLDEIGWAHRFVYQDLYDAASDEYHAARDRRKNVITSYLLERAIRRFGEAA